MNKKERAFAVKIIDHALRERLPGDPIEPYPETTILGTIRAVLEVSGDATLVDDTLEKLRDRPLGEVPVRTLTRIAVGGASISTAESIMVEMVAYEHPDFEHADSVDQLLRYLGRDLRREEAVALATAYSSGTEKRETVTDWHRNNLSRVAKKSDLNDFERSLIRSLGATR